MRRRGEIAVAVLVLGCACARPHLGPQLCSTNADCPEGQVCKLAEPDQAICQLGNGDDDDDDDDDDKQLTLAGNAVDILFVIDNSGSMGEQQGRLALGMSSMLAVLDDARAPIDYRIGFTTTDNGNPWCGQTTTPEAGELQLSSCRGRLEEFVFPGVGGPDATGMACTNFCSYSPDILDDLMLPLGVGPDPTPRLRPWIERRGGWTNLPESVTVDQAFRCFAPQGIAGCGFESPLESMHKALSRTQSASEASFGFLRDEAILAVIIVSDEVDCSTKPEHDAIFADDGGKVFWSDPDAPYPTSAVCWNAGVECGGAPTGYDYCRSSNKGPDGTPGVSDTAAVMQPLSRYISQIQELAKTKHEQDPTRSISVSIFGGVPIGYGENGDPLVYRDSLDPVYQDDFGIGPGCNFQGESGVPPVRMREWGETTFGGGLYSVCDPNFSNSLYSIGQKIADQIAPGCFQRCAADTDIDLPGLQPACTATQAEGGDEALTLHHCEINDEGAWEPAEGEEACLGVRTDPTSSDDPLDDLSDECLEHGSNLELVLVRRDGVLPLDPTSFVVECELAPNPQIQCPALDW